MIRKHERGALDDGSKAQAVNGRSPWQAEQHCHPPQALRELHNIVVAI